MRWEHVWSPYYMDQNARASLRTSTKVSLLELAEERWQTPSVSSPSTVVLPESPVKIGLSDIAVTLFYL
jgi:hypothetical protein